MDPLTYDKIIPNNYNDLMRELHVSTNMKTSHDNSIADSQEIINLHNSLLKWFANNKRALPWRALDAGAANVYHVWLSEIMLQQTTVTAVIPYFLKFIDLWPCVQDLAAADEQAVMDAWAGLGYYSRARNLHKAAQVLCDTYGGVIPDNEKALLALPGIGRYTAGAIIAIGYNKPALVVDGNIERIFARYKKVLTALPKAKGELNEIASLYMSGKFNSEPSFFVQGLMDLGSSICQPKKVQCDICPLADGCVAKKEDIALTLPLKLKKEKPQRYAVSFLVCDASGQHVMVERRPKTGLLANMLGFPTTSLSDKTSASRDAYKAIIKENIYVEHIFTHFKLKLYVAKVTHEHFKTIDVSDSIKYEWLSVDGLNEVSFPALYKKVRNII